jgi:hypothetical protein
MILLRLLGNALKPRPFGSFDITFGLWGGQHGGADPFGEMVRRWLKIDRPGNVWTEMESRKRQILAVLDCVAKANERLARIAARLRVKNPNRWRISKVSLHDGDLWPVDAPQEFIDEMIKWLKKELKKRKLGVKCFTTNLFSHRVFRTGAWSAPNSRMADQALKKACESIRPAIALGAENIIFWFGREGTETYERDVVAAIRSCMVHARVVVDYAFAIGYCGTFTFEPKVYEPRYRAYVPVSGNFSALIREFFPDKRYRGRVGINPELPQHVAMLCLSPVIELASVLATRDLISILHYGGQIPGILDADMGVAYGGNVFEDLQTMKLLLTHRWGRTLELDCRPLRTTTTPDGLVRFLVWNVWQLRKLEQMAHDWFNDPIVRRLRASVEVGVPMAFGLVGFQGNTLVKHVESLGPLKLDDVAEVNTDGIELLHQRTLQIVQGAGKDGAAIFADVMGTRRRKRT